MILRTTPMNILIFKTSISKTEQILAVKPLLESIPTVKFWNFDLDDCDNILRIVSNNLNPESVETLLKDAGYYCEELN